jgi:integrase
MTLQQKTVLQFRRTPHLSTKDKTRRLKLTQLKVERLRYGGTGAPEYVYDSDKPGLALRLTSGGARTFVFVGRLHGKVSRITLGRLEALSLAKARAAVDKIRGDLALGIDVLAQRKALREQDADRRPLNDVFAQFIAGARHKSKTARDYNNLWSLHIAPKLGKKAVDAITVEDMTRLQAGTVASVTSQDRAKRTPTDRKGHRTANKVVALLRVVLAFGGRKADNPTSGVRWFKQSPRRRRLNDEEAIRFRKALDTFEEPWRSFFILSLLTGMRRQSLLAMRWSDVELHRQRWVVPAAWSKHGDEMVIPLTGEAAELLLDMKQRRGASPWVFPSATSKSGHIEEPKAAWARLLKATGIKNLWLHDLRRTFGSRLAETGASGAAISAAMGHKSLQSARSYLHLQVDAVREAMERAAIKTDGER